MVMQCDKYSSLSINMSVILVSLPFSTIQCYFNVIKMLLNFFINFLLLLF